MEQIAAAHQKNMLIWTAILAGMLILIAVVYFLDASAVFVPVPGSRQYGQIFFIAAIVLASTILLLKRNVFLPEKIVKRVAQKLAMADQCDAVLARIRVNFLIVWTLAEGILITGFINYILTTDFNNFLIFAVVAVYSLIINIPRENTLRQAVSLLDNRGSGYCSE